MRDPVYKARFTILLVSLVAFFLVVAFLQSLAGPDDRDASLAVRFVGSSAYVVILVSAVNAARPTRHIRVIAWGLAIVAAMLQVASPAAGRFEGTVEILATIATIALLCMSAYGIVAYIVRHEKSVTLDMISGALCVYLLLAIIGGGVYSLVDTAQPGSFTQDLSLDASPSTNSLYFSLVTLTTLGYGDISPVSPWARMLAATEAVLGQIYLTVLVAYLVGIRLAQRFNR